MKSIEKLRKASGRAPTAVRTEARHAFTALGSLKGSEAHPVHIARNGQDHGRPAHCLLRQALEELLVAGPEHQHKSNSQLKMVRGHEIRCPRGLRTISNQFKASKIRPKRLPGTFIFISSSSTLDRVRSALKPNSSIRILKTDTPTYSVYIYEECIIVQ